MIREAISKVKAAVAVKDIIPHMTHYYVNGGFVHATNGHVQAAAPFPDDRTYLVPARAFDKSLEHMPGDDIRIMIEDNALKVSSGRYRAKLPISTELVVVQPPMGDSVPVPPGFMDKLKAVREFVSENATQPFALCILLDGEHMVATNNIAVVAAFEIGLPEMYTMLPVYAVDFVLGRNDEPTHIMYDDKSMSFKWDDGSWMRTQLFEQRFPEIAKKLIYDASQPEWPITPGWRDVYKDISSLTTSTLQNDQAQIRFFADKIVGCHAQGEFSCDIETPVPNGEKFSKWNPKFLTPVVEAAEFFDPTLWPRPCPFNGPLVAGVVQGMR